MVALSAHGIAAHLPAGFEGRVFRRTPPGPDVAAHLPVAHFATFALPPGIGDFGNGAVTVMGTDDVFVVLFEYGPESVGTALFARQGMPTNLEPGHFSTITLRRGLGGQSGTQWFFVEQGRPFTLYVVLGSHAKRFSLVPRVNALLRNLVVAPAASRTPVP
jgi:hypothetical protein